MSVVTVTSKKNFDEIIARDEPSIFDFSAAWCGPCKVISPIFERLAQEYYPNVKFYKVDVDEAEKAISDHARITAMPTFIVFRKGEALEGVRGAMPKQLQALISKHAANTEPLTDQQTQRL